MSMNPYSITPGWRIDPDNRQDRSCSPVITRQTTDEEKRKYGLKGDSKVNKLKITTEELLEICRNHGTDKEAYKIIADIFGIGLKTAENQVYLKNIRKLLAEEKLAKQKEEEEKAKSVQTR